MGAHRMACRKNFNSAVWALGRNRYLMLQMFDLYMPIYLVYCWDCREKAQHEKLQMLGNHNSPLSYVDLKVSSVSSKSPMLYVEANLITICD